MLSQKPTFRYLLSIVLILAIFRLIPHPPNATPVAAMALFAGAMFNNRWLAFAIPIFAMFLSDLWLGLHSTILYVYLGLVCTVVIGSTLKKISALNLCVAVLISSLIFYLLTNFGAWLHHEMYPRTINGLVQSYIAGLPFLRNSLIANFVFTFLVFYSINLFYTNKLTEISSK